LLSDHGSSDPLVFDIETRKITHRIALGSTYGFPKFLTHQPSGKIFVLVFDKLWVIGQNLEVLQGPLDIQNQSQNGSRLGVGEMAFTPLGTHCVIARPSSRDILAVETSSFRSSQKAIVNGEPFEATATEEEIVVARDRNNGNLLIARFEGDVDDPEEG
jgi:hypothetical protein